MLKEQLLDKYEKLLIARDKRIIKINKQHTYLSPSSLHCKLQQELKWYDKRLNNLSHRIHLSIYE